MKEKMVKVLCLSLVLGGFIIMLGTAGASDCKSIDFMETIAQLTVGLILTISGIAIGIVKEV